MAYRNNRNRHRSRRGKAGDYSQEERRIPDRKDSPFTLSVITAYKKIYATIPANKRHLGGGKYISGEKLTAQIAEMEQKLMNGSYTEAELGSLHKTISNARICASVSGDTARYFQVNETLIPWLARWDAQYLAEKNRDTVYALLDSFRAAPSQLTRGASIQEKYKEFESRIIRDQVLKLIQRDPEHEFPEVLAMKRRFILHMGPTNSGKTHDALERLKTAENGVYLGPLRLLALEIYDKMNKEGIPCSLLTGEEQIDEPGSNIYAATVEMLDFEAHYDIAVIDEAQFVEDSARGDSWVKAIMGIKAEEIHLCFSPEALPILEKIIKRCRDSYEIVEHHRHTELVFEEKPFVFPDDLQKGDALIVFSKKSVLGLAGRIEQGGGRRLHASVIYGNLPPEVRRRQVELFTAGETDVVVSTDAIGLGVNLPIRRVIFMDDQKFDGVSRRPLNGKEVRQIAGRAGRYLLYPTGYVNAHGQEMLDYVRKTFTADTEPITQARLGFPSELLDLSEPLDRIIEEWGNIEPSEPFVKVETTDVLFLYRLLEKHKEQIAGFEDKHTIYRMITCNIDVKNNEVIDQWLEYCKTYAADVCVEKPEQIYGHDELISLENYYKKLDLYFQFSNRLGKELDLDFVLSEKADTEARITELLKNNKRRYIPKCRVCGRTLTIAETTYGICNKCHAKRMMV